MTNENKNLIKIREIQVNKHKKNFLRSIIKEIKTTGKKIYWKSLFNITYFYTSTIFWTNQ
mgnify:CR=1 FL=1